MDQKKITALCKASLTTICILFFPIISGTLSVIMAMDTTETLLLQGISMYASLLIPLWFIVRKKWKWSDIGFKKYHIERSKKVYHFLPFIVIFIPVAIYGFYAPSVLYICANLFLYLAVGIAEEIYFRGMIPMFLRKAFSMKAVILLSTFLFGIGHIASAFITNNGWEVFLNVCNALLFGWLTMEMAIISENIIPTIILHVLFDFETKIVATNETLLLPAECVRGAIMFVAAIWLAKMIQSSFSPTNNDID